MVAPVARPVTLRTWLKNVGIIALVLSGAGAGALASSAARKPVLAEPREQDEHSPSRPQEMVEKEEDAEEEESEVAPDAMRDPLIAKAIRRRVLIEKPRFSMETGGKIQVQYYDSDSADSENEDEIVSYKLVHKKGREQDTR